MQEQRLISFQPDKANSLELYHFAPHFGSRRLHNTLNLRAVRQQQLQRCTGYTPLNNRYSLNRNIASIL